MTDEEAVAAMRSLGAAARQHIIDILRRDGIPEELIKADEHWPIHISINGRCVECKGVCRYA